LKNKTMRIAVLDDDPTQLSYLVHALARQLDLGDEVISCCPFSQGEALRRSLRQETYDLLVLDWNVPDLDGADLLNWLRNFQKSEVPVIMLSSRSSERDVASALGIGADDYVVKPFRTLELCARIRRLVARRPVATSTEVERFEDWKFDHPSLSVNFTTPDGTIQRISLTDREFRLALALFRHTGQPVSRAYLLETLGVHGEEMPSRALDSHVYRLRNKLSLHSASGLRLQTVYGRGYRLVRVDASRGPDNADPPKDDGGAGHGGEES
jgi:DNA-binding response OmpR family regulator